MRFKTQEVVRGISNMTYNIDGQTAVTKVAYIDVKLDADQGGKGCRTDAVRCQSQDVLAAIEHNPFPFNAELDCEMQATKGKTTMVILSITPLKVVGQPPPFKEVK